MNARTCDQPGCDRPAAWHARFPCPACGQHDVEVAMCDGLHARVTRLALAVLGIGAMHRWRTPECPHPSAHWHDDGCVLPVTAETVQDVHVDEAVPV